jgi:hypothetical protein
MKLETLKRVRMLHKCRAIKLYFLFVVSQLVSLNIHSQIFPFQRMMKSVFIFAAMVADVFAQCKTVAAAHKEIMNSKNPDPFKQLDPKEAVFPCDFGASVPLGKIPEGCGKLEYIYGTRFLIL